MNYDYYLVAGLVILVFAIPAMVSAYSDRRAPRGAAIMLLIGGGLIALALYQRPGGYTLEEIPQVFTRVVAQILN